MMTCWWCGLQISRYIFFNSFFKPPLVFFFESYVKFRFVYLTTARCFFFVLNIFSRLWRATLKRKSDQQKEVSFVFDLSSIAVTKHARRWMGWMALQTNCDDSLEWTITPVLIYNRTTCIRDVYTSITEHTATSYSIILCVATNVTH